MALDDEPTQHAGPLGYQPSSYTANPAFRVGAPAGQSAYAPQFGPQEYSTGAFAPPVFPPMRKKRGRKVELILALVAVLAAVGLGVAWAVAKSGLAGPNGADAERQCRSAIESEAQGRVTKVNSEDGTSAAATVAGVDIGEAQQTAGGWTVDGMMRFNLLSFLGNLPATVYVTCDATVSGGKISTSLRSR